MCSSPTTAVIGKLRGPSPQGSTAGVLCKPAAASTPEPTAGVCADETGLVAVSLALGLSEPGFGRVAPLLLPMLVR